MVLADCWQEDPPGDVLWVNFDVEYCNGPGAAPASATITSGSVSADAPPESLYWSFLVSPTMSPVVQPGECVTIPHHKIPDSGAGTGGPCLVCDSHNAILDLTLDVSGETLVASYDALYNCDYI